MNKVIEMLMEELDVGVCEDFRVNPSVAGQSECKGIYHFDELGVLRRNDGTPKDSVLGFLARGRLSIEKVEPKGRYIPNIGDYYYCVNQYGIVLCKTYKDGRDEYFVKHNLVFMTREEAEDYRWFLEQVDKYKEDFVFGGYNYCFQLYNQMKEIEFDYWRDTRYQGVTYFGSKENIKEFRNLVGDDRIKRYMFNI